MIAYSNQKDESYLDESMEVYNEVLAKSDAEIDEGQLIDHEEAVKKLQAWRVHEK